MKTADNKKISPAQRKKKNLKMLESRQFWIYKFQFRFLDQNKTVKWC